MSQLKVNSISDAAGSNGNAISLASDGTCTAKITNNLSNRRINENGACVIAQRGTSSTSTEYQTVDRWRSTFSQVSVTTTQHALTDADTGPWEKGFRYSYHLENTSTSSATNAWTEFGTRIEAQNICNSGWVHSSTSSYLTYSFWAKSSLAGTYYTWLRSKDSTNKVYASSFVLVANTWKKVSFTVPGAANVFIDNNNGVGLNVNISPYWGTDYTDSGTGTGSWVTFVSSSRLPDYAQNWCNTGSATFEATGLQLEAGDVATDFEHRSYGDELARCQRYCFKWSADNHAYSNFATGNVVATSQVYGIFQGLPVPMRAAATLTTSGNFRVWEPTDQTTAVTPSMSRGHKYTPTIALTVSSGTPFTGAQATECGANNDTSAQFTLSAEL